MIEDKYPGFVVRPKDNIEDAEPELPDFIAKDNEGWRKIADIKDGWQEFVRAVKNVVDRL